MSDAPHIDEIQSAKIRALIAERNALRAKLFKWRKIADGLAWNFFCKKDDDCTDCGYSIKMYLEAVEEAKQGDK